MEIKKSPKADLENKRSIYVLIGLVVALGFMYIVFEWTKTDVEKIEISELQVATNEEEEMVEITTRDETPPPPPEQAPPPPEPIATTEFEEKENDAEVADIKLQTADDESEVKIENIIKDEPEEIEDEEIYIRVEKKAGFPGGQAALYEFLNKNVTYPEEASDNGIQGRVFVAFVVNKDGSIIDVDVTRGVHPALDKEAIRVVKKMPKWVPAEQQGRKVRSKFTLPIVFKLGR